ncbi:MAG: hypothetical protein EOO38_27535, partial [Cytophagaceae bacterium]
YGEGHEVIETGTFTPDGDCLVTVSKSGTLRSLLLNADGASRTEVIRNAHPQDKGWAVAIGHSARKNSTFIALSSGVVFAVGKIRMRGPDGNQVLVYARQEIINSTNNGVTAEDEENGEAFWYADFTRDGTLLATRNEEGNLLRLWDLQAEQIRPRTLSTTFGHTAYDFKFSDDGRFLAGISSKDDVCVWCTRSGEQIFNLQGDGSDLFVTSFSPDNQFLATASRDGQVFVWDLRDAQQPRSIKLSGIRQIDTEDGEEVEGTSIQQIIFRPDGRYLALVFSDNFIQMCDFLQVPPNATVATTVVDSSPMGVDLRDTDQ